MRILIYGAGVIGSLYAALLSEAGNDVTVYARGRRLKSLQEKGLLYRAESLQGKDLKLGEKSLQEKGLLYRTESLQGKGLRFGEESGVKTAEVKVLAELDPDDRYDYIFLTVRGNQLLQALDELKNNCSPTIVTMVNSLDTYDKWEDICGKGRILPAFPGAGGGFDGDVLDAALTPCLIQPTTIGITDGRERELADILKAAKIPCQLVPDMHIWQICHLGMVVPIADAYYESQDPEHAGRDSQLMKRTAVRIKDNFKTISGLGMKLSPAKLNVFLMLPAWLIGIILGFVFRSRFGDRFMYQHSIKAPDEMRQLHDALYEYLDYCTAVEPYNGASRVVQQNETCRSEHT